MANDNNPCGFKPKNVAGVRPPGKYRIEVTYGTSLFIGDPVDLSGGYVIKATAGAGHPVLGIISHFECADGMQYGGYYPASSTRTYYAYVNDDPSTIFVGQDDGAGTAMDLLDINKRGDFVFTDSGDTDTNLSGAELDGSTFSGTAGGATSQCRILDLVDKPGNAAGANGEWEFVIHNHRLNQATA